MNVSKRQVLRYTTLPGVRSRLQGLFFSGFQYIPFFIALVYQTVKLLPAGHPYLDPANIGRFGVRHVIAEAANHLVFSKKNADQIILFGAVLFGLAIIFLQIVLLGISFAFHPVMAASMPTNFTGFFITAAPQQDLAMIMLDLVFGIPDLFGSCVNLKATCNDIHGNGMVLTNGDSIFKPLGWPFPIHTALHAMFRIYNLGLMVVAALITCYFIATVALETAQTGTPFGKRFNKLWAPIRIVVAFGLLMPMGTPGAGASGDGGLNASQYIVLYAAKFGSGFASNGWSKFNEALTDSYLGQTQNLVSTPNVPEIGGILQFMYVASTCSWLEWIKDGSWIKAYAVRDPLATQPNMVFADIDGTYADYGNLINFIEGGTNIIIRFGVEDENSLYKGKIKPVCGELVIPISDPRQPGPGVGTEEPGTEVMQRYYIYVLQELWNEVFMGNPPPGFPNSGTYGTESYPANTAWQFEKCNRTSPDACPGSWLPGPMPPASYRSDLHTFYQNDVQAALSDPGSTGLTPIVGGTGAVAAQVASATWSVDADLQAKGWAAAGIWYNKIAELNGSVTTASSSIPIVTLWPEVMEHIRLKKMQQDQNVPIEERFKPVLSNGDVPQNNTKDASYAMAMWEAFNYWQKGGFTTTSHTQPTGNIMTDAINAIFGTEGLFSMRRNPNVHPLAQLTAVGASLVQSSITNIGHVAVLSAGAAALSKFDDFAGPLAGLGASLVLTILMTCLSAGFVLYYIVPFLPFIYFFFAVGGWIKAIFEAMVGAPLWALAHIRIDGNGLPGAAAVNGYFLIFEIFLRPILIVFGLLASISIFAALVSVLNQVWDLVVSNVSGFDVLSETSKKGPSLGAFFRSALDEFFFTVIYAIIVYMMALSSFKLIDLIPANILRWMGQSVATENDSRENAAESLVGTASVGSNQAVQSIGGSLKGFVDSAGKKSEG